MPTKISYPQRESNIEITHLGHNLVDEGTKLKCVCAFCGKYVNICNSSKHRNSLITKTNVFYCNFCIKHNFYIPENTKDILILSFRGIIGFYYFCLYRREEPIIYLHEIKQYIDLHEKIGNSNPAFLYDPETYCWFLDFKKIGNTKKSFNLKYILETILEILSAFNMYTYYPNIKGYLLYKKYMDAILEFSQKKARPIGKLILSPTLLECDATFATTMKDVTITNTRDFIPQNLICIERFK